MSQQILTVVKRINGVRIQCVDSLGRSFDVGTDRHVPIGVAVLVRNGILIGTVKKHKPKVYEV